ncbi:hypothetical protein [Hymenobacter cavernae]|uniref:DUF937 domain-containing protein n=1 Tax=Hymenobacter cavernae TaxID=2044852 RepID=A0ABQ1UDW8_9BACT|nr:hypothetical protein [Hymenobacter cavernae]GGF16500.1 hypothetical protein GCM10011383_29880 [Hymenobacter cavernae]
MESKKHSSPDQDPDLTSVNTTDSTSADDLGSAATATTSQDNALTIGDEGVEQAPQGSQSDQDSQQSGNLFDSTIDALNLGAVGDAAKKLLDQSGIKNTVNQLPQNLKDLGSKATTQVNKLSTTQKIVGGALLLGGIGWLALRSKGGKADYSAKSAYRGSSAGGHTGTGKFSSGDSYGSRYSSTSSYSSPGSVNEGSYRGTSNPATSDSGSGSHGKGTSTDFAL